VEREEKGQGMKGEEDGKEGKREDREKG